MISLPMPISAIRSSLAPWNSAGYSIAPAPTIAPWPDISRGTECTVPSVPGLVREIVTRARAAGARSVTPIALHLRSGVREVFMDWLAEERPELVERYATLYHRGAYAPPEERRRLAELVRPTPLRHSATARFERRPDAPRPAPRPERTGVAQPSLF